LATAWREGATGWAGQGEASLRSKNLKEEGVLHQALLPVLAAVLLLTDSFACAAPDSHTACSS